MWAVCANVHKKQRVELYIKPKRKWEEINHQEDHCLYKRPKIIAKKSRERKKLHELKRVYKRNCKRLKCKSHHCLIHEEKYICDIYECSGVHRYQEEDFMSYII